MKILPFSLFIALSLFSYFFSNGDNDSMDFVRQSEREIPLISSVDVVVVGGTTYAVSAAVSAAEKGAKVYLIAPKPYLGEDLCATLRLKIDENRELTSEIEKRIFRDKQQVTPLEVKAALSEALLEADVKFIYGSFVTDVLWDQDNDPAGVVIVNRAGRQAIKAKAIIDATDHAWVCRKAGADVYPRKAEEIDFQRTVVMPGEVEDTPNYLIRKLKITMPDLHFSSFAQAEIITRERTYSEGQLRAGESLFYIPPDPVVCEKKAADWNHYSALNPDHFQVKGYENLFVLSGSADVPRSVAESLLKPAALTGIAAEIGKAVAVQTRQVGNPGEVFFESISRDQTMNGDIREILTGLRPTNNIQQTITCPETMVPVSGNYDVVVVGGGTSGTAAAIGAGRRGMKVLVLEFLEGLGGTGTLGMIGKPYHGKKVGFAVEVPFPSKNIEPKMEWYRSEIVKAGGDIWLGVLGAGAYTVNKSVKGVVVCSPEGRSVVTADIVIDATGNADIAIAAGAEYMYGDIERDDIALQGTGFSSRPLKGNYYNSDYLLVDETDMTDVWRTLVSIHMTKASENIYDVVPMVQNRERRRVVGQYVLDYLDQIAGRTFPDAIVFSKSDYDSHGYPSSPYFALLPHDEVSRKENHPAPGGICFTPYRCLLPKGLKGMLVTGLGISMDRDASAMIRMQFDLANQGYAAGVAASLAVKNNVSPENIDVKELQKLLVEKGNLPDSVLTMGDSFPLQGRIIEQAVHSYGEATNPQTAGKPLAIILSHKDKTMPFVKEAYNRAEGKSKLLYAQVLGMCGEKNGVPTLLKELEKFSGWDEKIFQGSMADYAHLPTPVDALILASGYSGDESAVPVLLGLVKRLNRDVTLSHHRSL
ncbi:MAG: FAD-dependent oxidoreductase, partial [Mariniphaga sp.]|nr:FAD-dependent oxidoreductase [Mariniphaga sp.]